MSRYLDLFLSEARQHLLEVEHELTRMSGAHDGSAEPVNNLYRHFHSLKGMSASMGFAEIATLSHAVEDLFDAIRKFPEAVRRTEIPELVLEALDTVSTMVEEASGGATAFASHEDLVARVRDACRSLEAPALPSLVPEPSQEAAGAEADHAPASAPPAPMCVFRCRFQLDPDADLPTARAALVLRRMESLGSVLTSTPSREELGREPFDGALTVLISTAFTRADLAAAIEQLVDVASYSLTEETLPSADRDAPAGRLREAEPALPSLIRIPTASLDGFLDTLGELITWRGGLGTSLRARDMAAATESHIKLSRAIDRLREEVMAIRLLPFEHIVPHLNQTVRGLCRQTGKKVSLQVSGTEVSLDRAVLEEILDPLTHLLRNAVDHGIESSEERLSAGKDPAGRILLSVARNGDRVRLRLEDDGRGMDTDRILKEAVRGGFISPTQAVPMSPEEILMLTTIPGFSTTEVPTEISGRGVGMDVVRTRIERLNGKIGLQSTPGAGLTVIMDLPLTVAVIEAFIVEAAGAVFAVPASVTERTLLASRDTVKGSRSGFFLDDGESLLPAFRPDEALGIAPAGQDLPESFPVLVFSAADVRGALAVDSIVDRRELVVKPLGSPLEHLREYSGAALLDDGRIALILDVPNLAQLATGG